MKLTSAQQPSAHSDNSASVAPRESKEFTFTLDRRSGDLPHAEPTWAARYRKSLAQVALILSGVVVAACAKTYNDSAIKKNSAYAIVEQKFQDDVKKVLADVQSFNNKLEAGLKPVAPIAPAR